MPRRSRQVISRPVRRFVRERAGYRCEYCQSPEWLLGAEHEIDHILPIVKGGDSDADNLCACCDSCNAFKQARTGLRDPDTGLITPLFNPRQDVWSDHFVWSDDGTQIVGLTDSGRATVVMLNVNNIMIVFTRSLWVQIGWHPPAKSQL